MLLTSSFVGRFLVRRSRGDNVEYMPASSICSDNYNKTKAICSRACANIRQQRVDHSLPAHPSRPSFETLRRPPRGLHSASPRDAPATQIQHARITNRRILRLINVYKKKHVLTAEASGWAFECCSQSLSCSVGNIASSSST